MAILANLLLGIPTANYFDDLGSPAPPSISEEALATLTDFCQISGVILKGDKTRLDRCISFLGLEGHFPGPGNAMNLSAGSTEEKEKPMQEGWRPSSRTEL